MKKILIVDDELSLVNFITDVVRILGFEPKFLTNGKKVLATAKSWKPDVITLDIMMPSPNGIEVLDQLKKDTETAAIPVFVMSALSADPEVLSKIKLAQAVFNKPIDTKEFIARLRQLDQIPAHPQTT